MQTNKSELLIRKENFRSAYDALRVLCSTVEIEYLRKYKLSIAKDLEAVLDALRWECEFGPNGEIVGLYFDGEIVGNEDFIFEVLAPFVDNGYIEMIDDNGTFFRWTFKDGQCKRIRPMITWPS